MIDIQTIDGSHKRVLLRTAAAVSIISSVGSIAYRIGLGVGRTGFIAKEYLQGEEEEEEEEAYNA